MIYKLDTYDLNKLIKRWSEEYRVFVPDENGRLAEYNEGMEINWHVVPVWGIKEFVFPARNLVAGAPEEDKRTTIIAGIRNCDLRALTGIFDRVFLEEDPVDVVYKEVRENLRIVTVDCDNPSDTCFCMFVGGLPFSDRDYDLNFSFIGEDILVDAGSEKGESLIEDMNYGGTTEDELKTREDIRDTNKRKVRQNFKLDYEKDKFGERVEQNTDKDYWLEKSKTCMQCGGCNFCCPTCYCNVLNEVSEKENIRKVLQWDSCHFPGYARVAGGANPRKELWQRFRHRYLCKFNLMLEEFEMPGCTGCGRCIQVCPGKIDIRETLKGL